MSDLIVIGYPDEHRAHDVWAELVNLVDLEDAAIIWRDENGELHVTTPAHHAVAKGTVSGLFWRTPARLTSPVRVNRRGPRPPRN